MKNVIKLIVIFILCVCIPCFITWLIFVNDGNITTDILNKSDWLSFWGSFLGFIGTTFLGAVTISQTIKINCQRKIEENRISVYPSINSNALFVYCGAYNLEINNKLESFKTDILLKKKDAKKGNYIYVCLPFQVTNQIPESAYIEYVEIRINDYPNRECLFKNTNKQFVPVSVVESNKFQIFFNVADDENNPFITYMEKSTKDISINMYINFKNENIVTPMICYMALTNFQGDDKIVYGLFQPKEPYMIKKQLFGRDAK